MAVFILLKETFLHADSQIKLILQISSKCNLLQSN